jgi:hypothetical protein
MNKLSGCFRSKPILDHYSIFWGSIKEFILISNYWYTSKSYLLFGIFLFVFNFSLTFLLVISFKSKKIFFWDFILLRAFFEFSFSILRFIRVFCTIYSLLITRLILLVCCFLIEILILAIYLFNLLTLYFWLLKISHFILLKRFLVKLFCCDLKAFLLGIQWKYMPMLVRNLCAIALNFLIGLRMFHLSFKGNFVLRFFMLCNFPFSLFCNNYFLLWLLLIE